LGFFLENHHSAITKNIHEGTLLCDFFIFNEKNKITYTTPNLGELDDSSIQECIPNIQKKEYIQSVIKAQNHLTLGDSYELNFTFEASISAKGDPFLLYQKLKRKQRTKCSAYFYANDVYTLSLSPEIFWMRENEKIKTFPMKGTAKRKQTWIEDTEASQALQSSEKERAENVMITDLFRNDLGKISEIGTVNVVSLFKIEPLDSVWQMTSEIESTLKPNINLMTIIETLFPSGSVTGAPKIKSMELLHDLEKRNRGIYTGSILILEHLNQKAISKANVAIRTLILKKENNHLIGTYAVGSGITILSDPEKEYEECLSKLSFLTSEDHIDFEILETIRFDSGRYRYLIYHLNRMKKSCERIGFPYDEAKAKETLDSISHVASGLLRIRLLVNRKGDFRAESYDFTRTNKKRKVNLCFSQHKLNENDLFLYHKTTIRDFYTAELNEASKEGCDDTILSDVDGNISETCLRNIFYKQNGRWFTPILLKGGLPGTLRQKLLEKKWISEKDITAIDLQSAEEVLVGNSLRGLERVNIRHL
jgi:para-aminobenzoate synthetase/4-amino-4-deoxychorismate lyase